MPDPLTHDALNTFRRVLDPGDNSTGGGSAAAIAGAMAGALVAMVARLSIRPDAVEPVSFYEEIAAEGTRLSRQLLAGSHEDAAAFDAVVGAYRLHKAGEAQVAARRAAIQAAMIRATKAPLGNGQACLAILELAARLEGRFNQQAASDLACANHLAEAGLLGCLANVEINLPGIKDAAKAEELRVAASGLRGYLESKGKERP